ncbi:MAG: FMN-binding protein [Solirubrobacteraceae bacterium]
MQRAPIVLSTTALGLFGALGYHAATGSSLATVATTTSATSAAKTTTATSTTTPKTATTAASSKIRTATGSAVSFRYGELQVKVTMSGTKLTNVHLVQLNVADPHSDQIDQSAIPALQQETISAGSAKISAISGASYTSAAYEQSLQSAIDKLTGTTSAA